jgi:D-hydroxyproline dehydrogenase subunit gamma
MATTSTDLRMAHASRGRAMQFQFDDGVVTAYEGETVAAALLAGGVRRLGANPEDGSPRGLFCAMGVCQECIVLVDGVLVEACRTIVREGLVVRSAA